MLMHASVPLGYYAAALRVLRKHKASGGRVSEEVISGVTIVVPTYNERNNIIDKLNNVADETKGMGESEVIVIDGGSDDGTADVAESWRPPPWVRLRVLREGLRRGKHVAENEGLSKATEDYVVFTDADSLWAPGSLRAALRALSRSDVGLVTCVKRPLNIMEVESGYRDLYNMLRLAESAMHSTPIAHGELIAIRRDLAIKLGGLRPGADDSELAHRVAMSGLRAVAVDGVICAEKVPRGQGYVEWRGRRAQHLVAYFASALRDLPRAPRGYRRVLAVEAYLHLVNPWLALAALALLLAAASMGQLLAIAVLALVALTVLAIPHARSWALMQTFLIVGALRNIRGRSEVWRKVEK